jgi:hypothetical protein
MGRFKELEEFEQKFETMTLDELRTWKKYWTEHARHLAPKVRKLAMKRVLQIDKKIKTIAQE